ncbi:MAG TPA: hypothetical protein VF720_04030 [Candidatus Eisenbacteria bacterium]
MNRIRHLLRLAALAALLAPLGCDYASIQLHFSGALVVYVYDDNLAIRGTIIEVVETGEKATTNASGLATFTLSPGTYTVRAYDINRGGPCCAYVEEAVEVERDGEARVAIWTCVRCR